MAMTEVKVYCHIFVRKAIQLFSCDFCFLIISMAEPGSSNSYLSPLACCGCSAFVNTTEESSALGDLDILDIKSRDKHL